MTTAPLKWWENILFFLGSPKSADSKIYECAFCKSKFGLMDLGDGDIVCASCWDKA